MKALIAEDAMLHYPDHNLPFHIYTDASDYQLGAVIMQNNKPVAYYSRKLNPAQRNYTTMEKELLSIVETLKELRTMLYGAKELHVHTDHRNLTYANLNSQRVVRWRLFLEEFGPTFHYVKGENNVVADAFSRLPQRDSLEEKSPHLCPSILTLLQLNLMMMTMLECFLNYPDPNEIPYPLDYALIRQHQINDHGMHMNVIQMPQKFVVQQVGQEQLICYRSHPQHPWRIVIPSSLLDNVIDVVSSRVESRWHDSIV